MPINTDPYSLHLHQIVKLAVILVASCASFSSSADSPNVSDQYFEDIANPLSLNFDTYKGLRSVTLEVIDVDQDGLKDIVVHFWEPDRGKQRTGITPNFLKVFRLTSSFSFEDYTETLFGRELIDLGGASRNIEVADLNNDGLLDVVFSINQEDGRIDVNNEYSDGELAAMVSTSEGYEIVNFGTPSWYHSLGVGMFPNGTNFVTGNGFSGNFIAEIFSFDANNRAILHESGNLEIPPNAFKFLNGSKNHSTELIRNADYPNMFGVIAYELINENWIKTSVLNQPYPKIGEVLFKSWNGADYYLTDVISIDGVPSLKGGGYSYSESCSLQVYPDTNPIAVLKLNSAQLLNYGTKEFYDQTNPEDVSEYNILIGFTIEKDAVTERSLKINNEQIHANYNFIDCLDVDGDSYQDIVAYAYTTTPLIYINNQRGEFNLLDDTKLPDIENSEVWPANTAAASIEESSILRDFTGDGIPDLFFWPANGIDTEDFGNDFTDGLGLKFFVGKQFLTKNSLDSDHDGTSDEADTFPLDATGTIDTDGDGTGNNADPDDDGDGIADGSDAFPLDASETVDTDLDGIGNNADTDDDNDGVYDSIDVFPLNASETLDTDSDGTGDNTDLDDDNDAVLDADDAFPLDSAESADTDKDGVGDNSDAFPFDATETIDTDSDGTGNNADLDDDNDGYSDEQEAIDGTNPLNPFSCSQGCFSFDIDADEKLEADALTDGLLVIRHLFGFSGDALVANATSNDATRQDATEITNYLNDAESELDIDGDGETGALTDGLILIRYLFGFSGDALISGAVSENAERTTAEQIEAYISERIPAI